MKLKQFIENVQILPLNLKDESQYQIFIDLYRLNEKYIKDDSIAGPAALANEIQWHIDNGATAHIGFVNGLPYGIIYAYFDRYNNANIHAVTYNKFENLHFFITQRFLKIFIKFLFEKKKVNKIKAEFPIYNYNAECALRYVGLQKEGQLQGEGRINGKPITYLVLGLTKERYFRGNFKDKNDIKFALNRLKENKKQKSRS